MEMHTFVVGHKGLKFGSVMEEKNEPDHPDSGAAARCWTHFGH